MYKRFFLALAFITIVDSMENQPPEKPSEGEQKQSEAASLIGATGLSLLTGYGGAQCYRIAQNLNPRLYKRILNITQTAVDILINNPALMKALAWKYERKILSPDEVEKASMLLAEFKMMVTHANPALYMATGALAVTSMFYAYQAVSHMYQLVAPISGIPSEENHSEPFLLTEGNKVVLKTLCYGGAAAASGLTAYQCHKIGNLFEFDSWEAALDLTINALQQLKDYPAARNMLTWWLNEGQIKDATIDKVLSVTHTGQTLLEHVPGGITILKGALSVAALYGTYKMITCGFEYFKFKHAQELETPTVREEGDIS